MTVTRAYRPEALVAEKTRQKVFEAAKKLEYWPNLNAQALRGGKTMSIGILLSNPVSNQVPRGISEKLMNKGYVTYIADSLGDIKIVESCLRDFRSRNVDSVILGWKNNFGKSPEICKLLSQLKNVILVAADESPKMPYDLCQFSCKNAYNEIVRYIISKDKKNIVFLGRSGYDYYQTVKNALKNNNCLTENWHWETSCYPSKPQWGNFIDALKDKLDAGARPDAILTSNDFIAARIIACLKDYNLKVPEDVAVVGLGNSDWGTLCATQLGTIDLQERRMIDNIFAILLRQLEGIQEKTKHIVIPAEFICRESAG
jgi:LacI family transcriptional regulator